MKDRPDPVLVKNTVEHSRIADIALIKARCRIHGIAVPCLQVVDDDNLLPLFHQLMHSMGSDIAGSAAY